MPFWNRLSINFRLLTWQNRQCKTIAPSLSSAGELLLPQDVDWTLVFVSFLSRYPSDTDNHIYSNCETRIWNPILLVLILCTASFQICLWIFPCVHQSFVHNHSISPRKISNLGGLSLVSSWKPCLFYHPFCYLQNVDFKGSHKISLSTVSRYLASNYLILFREQNIFRKNSLYLLAFYQLQLTFGMKTSK